MQRLKSAEMHPLAANLKFSLLDALVAPYEVYSCTFFMQYTDEVRDLTPRCVASTYMRSPCCSILHHDILIDGTDLQRRQHDLNGRHSP
jgi:hypothetical protein